MRLADVVREAVAWRLSAIGYALEVADDLLMDLSVAVLRELLAHPVVADLDHSGDDQWAGMAELARTVEPPRTSTISRDLIEHFVRLDWQEARRRLEDENARPASATVH